MKYTSYLLVSFALMFVSCTSTDPQSTDKAEVVQSAPPKVSLEAESFAVGSSKYNSVEEDGITFLDMVEPGWIGFEVDIPKAGRYKVEVVARTEDSAVVWLEDYYDNPDERTYNVTGNIPIGTEKEFNSYYKEGSPFNTGKHQMRLHLSKGSADIDHIEWTLMKAHQITPQSLTQSMEGEEWELVWSDEFENSALDTTKWIYDIGNWGWGNNELQYYTEAREENARVEDGHLIIEARKNDMGEPWTSARLTTRGRVSFLYGKIEFRAKVPREKGNWAAGWTLGDSYVDEKSWPYCGEIDILESVGYEVDNESGDGIAHATVHTPAYYFKIGNQISSTKEIDNIAGEFHTYAVEWRPTEIRGYVDGEEYYLYDKHADEKEWPFGQPQNIILNLAMGGGWGGAQGMDETVTSQQFIIDYVRVYGKK